MINPKRHDCTYPDKNLAGVGVALKLVQALVRPDRARATGCRRSSRSRPSARSPTSCRWSGENRVIAKLGLGMLSKGPHKVGLRSLLDVCGLTGKEIDSYHIGFVLAPRVNAAGRMSTPDIAARLLLASDEAMAERGARAGRAAQHREHAAAARGSRDRRAGEEDRRDRPRGRLAHGDRRRRRGLAPRRHRHRRLEAGRRVSPAGHRAVDRRRRGARVVPQHPVVQHAGGARVVRRA